MDLATLLPNTTTQGGGVLGAGGSVGGARPRMNNFSVDGLDDNDVSVTGPISTVIQDADAVSEFTVINNQFSAEYGHSAAGQFNLITKSGTNNWHGNAFWFTRNRKLNALDNIQKASGLTAETKPRFDHNTGGGTLGGPIVKNKVFIFGAFQKDYEGRAGSSSLVEAPTATGLVNLKSLAENGAVTSILDQFPTAGSATRTINVTKFQQGSDPSGSSRRDGILRTRFLRRI